MHFNQQKSKKPRKTSNSTQKKNKPKITDAIEMNESDKICIENISNNNIDDDDDDECLFCMKRLLSHEDVSSLMKIIQLQDISAHQNHNNCKRTSSNRKKHQSYITNDIIYEKAIQLQDTMIFCDSCEGTFHMLCMGLTDVPEGEWSCRWCEEEMITDML